MDKIKKLLKKVSKQKRGKLKVTIKQLVAGEYQNFIVKKIKSMQCFRIRVGRFRVFFKVKKGKVEIIDVRLRNEGTYKK